MDPAVLRQLLHRPATAQKYDFGHVLVVGGSPGMVGAPLLSAEAALRMGAGLVTIAAPAEVADKLDRRVREVMTLALPDPPGAAAEVVRRFATQRRVSALAVGPGLRAGASALVLQLLRGPALPTVLDAGVFVALRDHLDALDDASERGLVLTPHAGEYEKLTGEAVLPGHLEQRREVADFAGRHGVTLVLKGHHTLVAHPDGTIYENTTGNPGLATAGTGDVLTGMIAGLLAQGLPPRAAAEAGVYLHGVAGDLAAEAKTQSGMIASDVTAFLPEALKKLASI
ncbi:MAG TPA: NAD(P)H-hydrate dehydratase [Candidatus Saccharimonadia bacterium]|jgi:NAD(P)H-hydrate epimerase|nr:NAD(P)H-hydrate dehydratase [Candidatus Saccharimonadia bacterium]